MVKDSIRGRNATPLMTHENAMYFIGCLIDRAQLDSPEGRTQWGICLASPKLSNMFDFISTFLHFHFTSFTENHRNACKMASNELQPSANAQCPPKLMRAHMFELSTEAFYFYGSAEVLRKSCISSEQRRLILRKS